MTASTAVWPTATPSTLSQWWVLTIRSIAPTLRNGEVLLGITASAVLTAGWYIPLNQVIGPRTGMSSFAQYLTPLIALQAIAFASVSAAFRAASDSKQGINRRFGAMPIAPATPLAARMSGNVYRCAIGLITAILCGHVIGFRFYGGPAHTAGFCVLVMVVGAALAFLGDVIGTASRNPEATTQWLALPQVIFGMLSTGIQPAERFPHWLQPIVRNQPISQFVYAMRALAGDSAPDAGTVNWSTIAPSLFWIVGVILTMAMLSRFVLTRRGR